MRFGAYHIYLPALLKPAPRALAAQLWALKHGGPDAKGLDELLHLAASGRTSIPVDKDTPKPLYRTAGYRVCGERAVRVDILERLADLIRPALAWREGSPGAKPAGAFDGCGFTVTGAMTSLTGASGEDFASILRSLGYRMERKPKPAEVVAPSAEAAATETAPAETAVTETAAPSELAAAGAPDAGAAEAAAPEAGAASVDSGVAVARCRIYARAGGYPRRRKLFLRRRKNRRRRRTKLLHDLPNVSRQKVVLLRRLFLRRRCRSSAGINAAVGQQRRRVDRRSRLARPHTVRRRGGRLTHIFRDKFQGTTVSVARR